MSVRFSVVVPAYQSEGVIGQCLAALRAQTTPASEFEVVVVDDGSSDATASRATEGGARVLRQPNAGPAAARNAGARAASGEIVLFTDADCRPEPGWLAAMTKPFERVEVSAVQGRYVGSQSEIPARFAQLEFEERYERIPDGGEIDFVFTYAAAYRRTVFFDVGGFDVAFPAPNGEDMDLAFRLQAKGHRFVFARSASVRHVHPSTWSWYFCQKFTRAYWRQRVYARFPSKAISDSYTPQSMKLQIALGLLLPPALLLGRAVNPGWMGVWVLLFLASCGRIAVLAWRRDRALLAFLPFGCLVRALALGSGSLAGVTQWIAALRERRAAG